MNQNRRDFIKATALFGAAAAVGCSIADEKRGISAGTGKKTIRIAAWLKDELAGAKAAKEPVILGGHMPPFVANAGERDSYENCPKKLRVARLKMYRDSGVRYFLSGHTHRLIVRAHKGMTILNPETTSRNFDELPYGFRMLTLHPDGSYGWDFHRVSLTQ